MAGIAKQDNQRGPLGQAANGRPVVKNHWAARKAAHQAGVHPGLVHGFRSGLEEKNDKWLKAHGIIVAFESLHIKYVKPTTFHTYTPDFPLPNGIIVETKGKFEVADRQKHILIKKQYPDLDIRFVFQRPSDTISPNSKTTYGAWATKNGFKWAAGMIPPAWMQEEGPVRKPEDVLAAGPQINSDADREAVTE